MNPKAAVVCLRLTDPDARVPTTLPAHACARRHAAMREGLASHLPLYPDCHACPIGKGVASALAAIGWTVPRWGRLRPTEAQKAQHEARRRYYAEHYLGDEDA